MSRSAELLKFLAQLRIADLIDFIIVWAIIYGLLKLVRGTRAVQMAMGLLGVGLLYQISAIFGLETLQFVMRNTLLYFGFAILVIFAPEIRSALMRFGSNLRRPLRFGRSRSGEEALDEIVLAATTLSSRKIGALVVVERTVGLQNYIDTGVALEATLSYDLLVTIFEPHTQLHDDAVAVVVCEETGILSFVSDGKISRYLNSSSLREMLRDALSPPRRISEIVRQRRLRARKPATIE